MKNAPTKLSKFWNKKVLNKIAIEEVDYESQIINHSKTIKLATPNGIDVKEAWTKAWENRDFEISKYWSRAAYFLAFIFVIFTGYITLITSEEDKYNKIVEKVNNLDLYLLLLGLIFSVAWFLAILGSKFWQRNWEAHIDELEDYVTGPLYKTVFYDGKTKYSVSKINEVLALVIILVWFLLIASYMYTKFTFTLTNLKDCNISGTCSIYLTIFVIVILFRYPTSRYKTNPKNNKIFFDRRYL